FLLTSSSTRSPSVVIPSHFPTKVSDAHPTRPSSISGNNHFVMDPPVHLRTLHDGPPARQRAFQADRDAGDAALLRALGVLRGRRLVVRASGAHTRSLQPRDLGEAVSQVVVELLIDRVVPLVLVGCLSARRDAAGGLDRLA